MRNRYFSVTKFWILGSMSLQYLLKALRNSSLKSFESFRTLVNQEFSNLSMTSIIRFFGAFIEFRSIETGGNQMISRAFLMPKVLAEGKKLWGKRPTTMNYWKASEDIMHGYFQEQSDAEQTADEHVSAVPGGHVLHLSAVAACLLDRRGRIYLLLRTCMFSDPFGRTLSLSFPVHPDSSNVFLKISFVF